MSEKIDNNIVALANDPHDLGEFRTVYDAMRRYPNGGVSGDYITILGVKHFWNINRASWGILKDKEDNLVQMVEDMITHFKTDGYLFAGVATPDTVPIINVNAFYLAVIPGEYTNFGLTIGDTHSVYLFRKVGSEWVCDETGIVSQPFVEIKKEKGDSDTATMSQRAITNLFNDGRMFAGIATPDTVPIVPKGDVYYLASEKGIYSNFGDIELDGSVLFVLKNTTKGWEIEKTSIPIDPELVVSNAEATAKEAKRLATEAKDLAEQTKGLADGAFKNSDEAKKNADLSLTKSSNNERLITAASGKVDDLSVTLTGTTQKSTEALGLAKGAVKTSDRGMPNGIPILDGNGKIPQSQLPLTKTELVNSFDSDAIDKAPTADAVRRLKELHEGDMKEIVAKLDAVLDLVGDTTELGISPTQINITSQTQTVRVQVFCNGEWTVNNVAEGITINPLRGNGLGSFTVEFPENSSTTDNVTGLFKVANSYGKEKKVNYTQYSASTRYVYELTATPASIDVTALAGNGHFDVVSTKTPYINDTPTGEPETVGYTLTIPEGISWMRLTNDRSIEQYEYDENLLEASRSVTMTIKQEGVNGKTIEIPFNQAKATTYTEFKFSIVPIGVSIDDNGAGGVYSAKITSTKTVTVNGNENTSEVPYTVSYEGEVTSAWAVVNTTLGTITLPINNNEFTRSGAIVFTQEGVEANIIRVPVTQAAATIAWNYTFTVNPSEIRFGNAAGKKTFEVSKCVKKKTVNGIEVGDEIQVAWDVSLIGDVFTLDKETCTISVLENTSAQRSAELILTRPELGADDKKVIPVIQEAGVVTWTYTLDVSAIPTSIAALNGTTALTVNSSKQKYINGIAVGEPIAVGWHGTSINGYLSGADQSGATWSMQENQTESSRVDGIIINQLEERGKSKTLNFTQLAGTISYEYTFNVTPSSIELNIAGTAQSVNVISVRQKKINGNNVGGVENVNWSSGISSGFNINGASISAPQNNTESSKSGTATFTQTGSGKQASINISQLPGAITLEYIFTADDLIINYNDINDHRIFINSYADKYVNGIYHSRIDLAWVLNSPTGEDIESRDGNFSINLDCIGYPSGLYVYLVGGDVSDDDFATISLTQHSSFLATLEIKVFYKY